MKSGSGLGSGLALLVIGGLIGNEIAKSKGRERIAALQREILRLQRLNASREEEIRQLRSFVTTASAELDAITGQRRAFAGFVEWLNENHPELLYTYQRLTQAEARIVALQGQVESGHRQLAELQTRH